MIILASGYTAYRKISAKVEGRGCSLQSEGAEIFQFE